MKAGNIVIGGEYWCRVSGKRVMVEVVGIHVVITHSGRRQTLYRIKRKGGGTLPRMRTCLALSPIDMLWVCRMPDFEQRIPYMPGDTKEGILAQTGADTVTLLAD